MPSAQPSNSNDSARDALLDAAEPLFYEHGYQAVGMDAIRAASGLSLKRIYAIFPSKEELSVAVLDRRDDTWHASLVNEVDRHRDPEARLLAVFDWLEGWLATDGYRGCAWLNAFGELGGTSPAVAQAVRRHKTRFRTYLDNLAREAGAADFADSIYVLAEGSMACSGIAASPAPAGWARAGAAALLARRTAHP
ncbi:MAG: TetR/AcrR family transcriptional regulator [Actinomyces bowdenii]|nr:TetR/AcrR family transcriptional regulator [Actinomyces bowdenii]